MTTVEIERANHKLAYLRKGSRLLNQITLIGGLLTSQIIFSSLTAQAAPTGYDRIESGCGVGRPFVKGYTTWYGGVNVTNGWADSALKQWNGSTYVEIAYQYGSKQGPTAEAAADAGKYTSGRFYGYTNHDTSFWVSERYHLTSYFSC